MSRAIMGKVKKRILSFISKNKKLYNVIVEEENCLIIAKRKTVRIHSVNENSIFQPVEQREEKTFVILFGITLQRSAGKNYDNLMKMGCPFISLTERESVERALEGI